MTNLSTATLKNHWKFTSSQRTIQTADVGREPVDQRTLLLLTGLMPLMLASCSLLRAAPTYSVKVTNGCKVSKRISIDGVFQKTIASGQSIKFTKIAAGSHTLQASGLEPVRVNFDQDKVWTLCP
jgi:hypothetical protein